MKHCHGVVLSVSLITGSVLQATIWVRIEYIPVSPLANVNSVLTKVYAYNLTVFAHRVIMVIALHTLVDIASSVVLFFFTNLFYFIAVYTFQKVNNITHKHTASLCMAVHCAGVV